MEIKERWTMPDGLKVALVFLLGAITWLGGFLIGTVAIELLFEPGSIVLVFWGIILFLALAFAVGFATDDIIN